MFNYDLLTVIASIVIVLSIGYFAKSAGILRKEDASTLNDVIIYLALPVFIFRGIYKAQISNSLIYVPIIAFLTTALMVALAYFIARFLKLDRQLTGTFMLAAGVGNTGYIAYPLLIELLGNKGLVRGIFYDLFGTVLFMLTIGLFICSNYGKSEEKPSVLKELFLFPPGYALVLGFLLRPIALPEIAINSMDLMANITVGLVLIAVGLSLEFKKGASRYLPLIIITFILKLLLAPLLVFIVAENFLNLPPVSVTSMVLSASMPTAVLALIFGIKFKLNVEFLSSAIFILTIASIVTVPLGQMLLRLAI